VAKWEYKTVLVTTIDIGHAIKNDGSRDLDPKVSRDARFESSWKSGNADIAWVAGLDELWIRSMASYCGSTWLRRDVARPASGRRAREGTTSTGACGFDLSAVPARSDPVERSHRHGGSAANGANERAP